MQAPDKIYVPIVNLGIEEGEHPAPLWWNKDKKSEHPDVVGTIEYIRKDALLGWAKEQKKETEDLIKEHPKDDSLWAEMHWYERLINHIESL